jgi:valyl-tRNA synthetase
VYAINPVNGREVPVFIGDFVLGNYGTGAVMAVPSHDQRDFEYAIAHNIPMIQVIEGRDVSECAFEKQDYLGKGCKLMNSEEFTGLTVEEAKEAITVKLENAGVARRKNNYHFREWIFARQRYWGEPVPCVYTEDGETVFPYAQLAMNTSVEMRNLTVTDVYTTDNEDSSSNGAITLYCQVDGYDIQVRTTVLKNADGSLITQDRYVGKTIDVKGIIDYYQGEYQIKVFVPEQITIH